MSNLKTLEQGRAAFAFEKAKKGIELPGKEYAQQVKKLPMLIKTNGLGASIAFYAANKDVHRKICEQILEWFKSDYAQIFADFSDVKDSVNFAGKLTSLNSSQYKAVTIETLAFLNWLKRFADGLNKE